MEDLFRVVTSSQSTSPIERVIIIDQQPNKKSSGKSTTRKQSSIRSNTRPIAYQSPKMLTFHPNHVYLTTAYNPNTAIYYPFVYFRY